MLIMPPGHQTRLAQRRPFTQREKWGGIATGLVVLVVVIAVLVSVVANSSTKAKRGCIDVAIASSLGSQTISGCGNNARALCSQLRAPGSNYSGEPLSELTRACRRAGLPTT